MAVISSTGKKKRQPFIDQAHLSSGNTSAIFGPVDDSFLPNGDQYLGQTAQTLLQRPSLRQRRCGLIKSLKEFRPMGELNFVFCVHKHESEEINSEHFIF
jgi:hypothetical protein